MFPRRAGPLAVVVLLTLAAAWPVLAQRDRRFGFGWRTPVAAPVPYDGRFTIVRLWYPHYAGWSFDYPDMEQNLTRILDDMTAIRVHPDGSNIFRMDDPDLLNRFRSPTCRSPATGIRATAKCSGCARTSHTARFLIVDDFHFDDEWRVFEAAMRRVLPDARIDRLDVSHPVFDTFFPSSRSTCRTPAGSASGG